MNYSLATATFCGKINRISPKNSKDPDYDDRNWIIWLEVAIGKSNVLVKFYTNQKPIPWLISQGRIKVGDELSVLGELTSLNFPTSFTDGKPVVHLSGAYVPPTYLYYDKTTTFVSNIVEDLATPVF